jgi:hypothetical protein
MPQMSQPQPIPLFGPALAGLTAGLAERAESARVLAPLYLAILAVFSRLIESLDRLVALHNAGLLPPTPQPAARPLPVPRNPPAQGRKSQPWWQFWRTSPAPRPTWPGASATAAPFPHADAPAWDPGTRMPSRPPARRVPPPPAAPHGTPPTPAVGAVRARLCAPRRTRPAPIPASIAAEPPSPRAAIAARCARFAKNVAGGATKTRDLIVPLS